MAAMMAVPVFIHYLGIKGYGLIGFYSLLISSAQLAELGIGTAVARRIAQLREHNAPASAIRSVALVTGLRYGILVAAIALIVFGPLRPLLVHYVADKSLDDALISRAILLMGIAITGHLAVNYLTNLMLGLEKHFVVSGLRFIQIGMLQLVGAMAVAVQPEIDTYFLVQITSVWFLMIFAFGIVFLYFRNLPGGEREFNVKTGLGRRVTTGIATITLLGFFFSQIDRIVLSGSVSLSDFGYYSLAFSVINAVNVLVVPAFNVLMPMFSRRASSSQQGLWKIYRETYWINQSLLVPAIAILIFLPRPALWAWTGNSHVVSICVPLVQLLAVGALAQGLTNASWLTQLGLGRMRAEIVFHITLVVLTPLGLIAGLHYWGLPGAALAMAGAHIAHLTASSLYVGRGIFKRLPIIEMKSWYYWMLFLPSGLMAWLMPADLGRITSGAIVLLAYGLPALIGLLWTSRHLALVKLEAEQLTTSPNS